jgi:hypothetical protein
MSNQTCPPKDEEFVDVELIMSDGKRYVFPDVQWQTLWLFIRSEDLSEFPQLSLVNYARSCLTIMTADLKYIIVCGQTYWTRPSIH